MISRVLNFFADLDSLMVLCTVIAGVGLLGYVAVSWLVYLFAQSQHLYAASLALVSTLLAAAAFVRIPIALVLLLGGAMACGTGFLLGYGPVFMP